MERRGSGCSSHAQLVCGVDGQDPGTYPGTPTIVGEVLGRDAAAFDHDHGRTHLSSADENYIDGPAISTPRAVVYDLHGEKQRVF